MANTHDQAATQDQAYFDKMKQQILDALETVIDPELGIDLINLGLIYGVDLDENGKCTVEMTLTTMGCPLTDMLDADIKQALTAIDGSKALRFTLSGTQRGARNVLVGMLRWHWAFISTRLLPLLQKPPFMAAFACSFARKKD